MNKVIVLGDKYFDTKDLVHMFNCIIIEKDIINYDIIDLTRRNLDFDIIEKNNYLVEEILYYNPKILLLSFNLNALRFKKPYFSDIGYYEIQKIKLKFNSVKNKLKKNNNDYLLKIENFIRKIDNNIMIYFLINKRELINTKFEKNKLYEMSDVFSNLNFLEINNEQEVKKIFFKISERLYEKSLIKFEDKKLEANKKKETMLIIGDSLPLPNKYIEYEKSYPYKLKIHYKKEYNLINLAKRSNDTEILTRQSNLEDDIINLNPNIIILNIGINDCTPRLFNKKQKFILGNLPSILRKMIIKLYSRNRYVITKFRKKVYVKESNFVANIEKVVNISRDLNSKLIIISINETNEKNNYRNYGMNTNIKNYNNRMEELSMIYNFSFIDINVEAEKLNAHFLIRDGIHFNEIGNNIVFERIIAEIETFGLK